MRLNYTDIKKHIDDDLKTMKEINTVSINYRQRFNKMYEMGYDLDWFDKEIPSEVTHYIQKYRSNGLLDVKTARVLDLGCGRGRLLRYFEQQGFNSITGVDVSEVASRLAKQYTSRSEILVGDIIKGLPFKSSTFSLVTELTVLSSLNPQYWSTILNEIHRILKRGGFYISEIFARDHNSDLNQPLITSSVIPKELDQVYGVTKNELVNIFAEKFSIKECLPFKAGPHDSFFVLSQKL